MSVDLYVRVNDYLPTTIIALAKLHALELNLLLSYLSNVIFPDNVDIFGLLQAENSVIKFNMLLLHDHNIATKYH